MARSTTMSSSFVPNPFRSISEMCAKLDLSNSKYALGWRLVEYKLGHIHGLPLSRGRICASDGISCIIITPNGFYIGHHAWFVIEKEEQDKDVLIVANPRKQKVGKKEAILAELNDLLSI